MAPAGPTVKSLDDRLDDLERTFTDFKGRVETVIQLARWLCAFAAGTMVTTLLLAFSAAYTAGVAAGRLDAQGRELERQALAVEKLQQDVSGLKADVAALRADVAAIKASAARIEAAATKGK